MEKDYMYQSNDMKDINTPIKDYRTDWAKGIRYYTCDGKEVASMEQVMQYNQMYYENMMIRTQDNIVDKSGGMHR